MSDWGMGEWFVFLVFFVPVVSMSLAVTIRICIEILRGD